MAKKKEDPWHISTFSKGANFDVNKEILFAQEATGKFVIARNARPISIDGESGALQKFKGETKVYDNSLLNQGYTCVASFSVNEYLVEIWGNNSAPGIITMNGKIVLKSAAFEQSPDYPLQWDVNNNCIGGEFFITDNRVPPYIFNAGDLWDSSNPLSPKYSPTKYFSSFDPDMYAVNLNKALDIPVFIELISVGGGGGLPAGSYQYSIRYVTKDGDRTNKSQRTPTIPVMQAMSENSRVFPYAMTYGGPPDPAAKTGFGIQLRFRVTNLYNYDYIELIRYEYNQGAGIDFSPSGTVVAKIEIAPGELSIVNFIDPVDSNTNTPITVAEETQQLAVVDACKTLRYFDKRLVLMNIKHPSKEADIEFLKINNKDCFPVIEKIGKVGYKDAYTHTYKKKYLGGEKYSFGIVGFDGVGSHGFVSKGPGMLDNFQFPNRRDIASTETKNYSYDGTVRAATVLVDNVDSTHEVFSLEDDAVYKSDECNFKNIIQKGPLGITGKKSKVTINQICNETDAEIESHGAEVTLTGVATNYHPFTPVRENDPDVEGHNYVTDISVFVSDSTHYNYRPKGFAPNYWAMGIMIPGISNIPRWMKSFSVVRSKAAGRVVCQGLGYYSLLPADFDAIGAKGLGSKEKNKFWFHSPDIDSGMVSAQAIDDIIANPQNYKLQFVSPLGFFSELYSAEDNLETEKRDRILDMITYVRMIRDNRIYDEASANQINPDEEPTMGYDGGDGKSYIGYERFRNSGNESGAFQGDGNKVFGIAQSSRVIEGRGGYLQIETTEDIYETNNIDGGTDRDFQDSGLIRWTEPVYVINIIREGASITDKNIQGYVPTGHYQKIESIIGKSNGQANQSFPLVDERWEDCIPSISGSSYGASTNRYVYVRKLNGEVEKWVNVVYKTPSQKADIIASIQSFGHWNTDVKGVFVGDFTDNSKRFAIIRFNVSGFVPEEGAQILVRYDNTAPIRVFGGDSFVSEGIFAPIDREGNAEEKNQDKRFAWGIGLPYFRWELNHRYYTIRKADAAINEIQDEEKFGLGYFRQLCAMYTVESRASLHYSYNLEYPLQSFPSINYVIRPNRWKNKSYDDLNIFQDYGDDYGVEEKDRWKWGGFRFLPQTNSDYSIRLQEVFTSKPVFGFVEQTEFCTRVSWSLARDINVQDSPGLKTFPANNKFDISDDQGDIVKAYDSTTEKGSNLYAFCEKGICLLLTSKSILSDLNSGKIGYMAADSFVQAQYWLNQDTGMDAEWWRSAAEGFVPITREDGSEVRLEAMFFSNGESAYMFMQNTCLDIGRIGYYSRIKRDIDSVLSGFDTHVTGFYDRVMQEYWLHIKNGESFVTHVFGKKNMMWYGTTDFMFDKFSMRGTDVFGSRNMQTFKLHEGFKINGEPVVFEAMTGAAPDQKWDKEFVRTRVNSSDKPTRIGFYKTVEGAELCSLSANNILQGGLYMKDYVGYEGQIPRMITEGRPRFQNRLLLYKISHNLEADFTIVDSLVSYKLIK